MSVQIQPISDTVDIHSIYVHLSYVSKRACAIRKAFAQHIAHTIRVAALSHGHNAIPWSQRYHMVSTLSRGPHAIFLSKSNEHT